ncbi:MAG: L-threonylcarbamoyladenylate synthase [Bacilli bacterium]
MISLSFNDEKAVEDLRNGFVVALPTETVYGFAIRWDSFEALKTLCEGKGRDINKPISIMVGTNFDINSYFEISAGARKVIDEFLPGPLTVLLKPKSQVPSQVVSKNSSSALVGVRIPDSPDLLSFLNKLEFPLQVTSANESGEPPLLTFAEIDKQFTGIKGFRSGINGPVGSGCPTTVVDLSGEKPEVRRLGQITQEEIDKAFFGK